MTRNIYKYIKNNVILIKNFNDSLSSTFKCDAYLIIMTPKTTLAAGEANSISRTAESGAIRLCTPGEEHKTPINNNNTIVQTTIIYAYIKRGERVCGIDICGCDIKCRQLI